MSAFHGMLATTLLLSLAGGFFTAHHFRIALTLHGLAFCALCYAATLLDAAR